MDGFATYKGWRAYHAECHVCHGPDAMGSTYAPSLMTSVQRDDVGCIFDVIINGRGVEQGAQKGNVMPALVKIQTLHLILKICLDMLKLVLTVRSEEA